MLLSINYNMSREEPAFKKEILEGEIAQEVYGRDNDIPTEDENDQVMISVNDNIDEDNPKDSNLEDIVTGDYKSFGKTVREKIEERSGYEQDETIMEEVERALELDIEEKYEEVEGMFNDQAI
jgi:hypothetical protein